MSKGAREVSMTSAPDVHPEFGYFCPAPRLRRDFRVAIVSVLLGGIMGGGGIIALGSGLDRHSDSALQAEMATSGSETVPFVGADSRVATADAVTQDDTGNLDRSKPDTVPSNAANTACGEDIRSYRDGSCLAPRLRWVRVREARGGIAGIPLGQTDAASSAAALSDSRASPTTLEAAPNGAPEATPPVAAPKKPQKSARSQNRRRDEAGDGYSARDERSAPWIGRRFADDEYSRRGSGRGGAWGGRSWGSTW
jgi:hypothetical protein